ncbi:hypothetical protein XENOCAPTIV_005394 [Xenoophorus captivus]|uniref:Uncharacterized protein n=1 Tax=Xenoophorus captivus TaxID=1517983 RepID=A0ABV0R7C8_9TELE
MRNPHSGVPGTNLQSPYQQSPFSLHQKPEFLAYTDFSTSCLVPSAPHAAYPRDDRLYQDSQGGYPRADWQFNPCETRSRSTNACPPVSAAVVATGGGGGPELESVGTERLLSSVPPGCLDGEYSPQSVASADSDKKSSNKRKRDATGRFQLQGQERAHSVHQGAAEGAGGGVHPPQLLDKTPSLRDCRQPGPHRKTGA